MRFAAGMGIVLTLLVPVAVCAQGPRVLDENPYYLRSDPRLQVRLNLDSDHPRLGDIVATLHDATGLVLTVDEGLGNHNPDFGSIQHSKSGYRAWQLMEMVARKGLQNGYWEKTSGGYRLKAEASRPSVTSSPRPNKERDPSEFRSGLVSAMAVLVVGLVVMLALRVRRQLRTATSPREGSGGPTSAR